LANACGPCIGQWERKDADKQNPNSIITSFNRNFAKRNDGNPNTHAFVASAEIVTAYTFAGTLDFNPLTDYLVNDKGEKVMLAEPTGIDLPLLGFEAKELGYIAPVEDGTALQIVVDEKSTRLQLLEPFAKWDGKDFIGLNILIKAKGKCTTDHISMAGPWLEYRGHLDNISNNLLLSAVNAFTDKANAKNPYTNVYDSTPKVARYYRENKISSIVIGDENYGEGSSREHAAMEPRFMGVKVVLVKSFARIHETNLKKQGMLALTFVNAEDYNKIQEDDKIDIIGLTTFTENVPLKLVAVHKDGTKDEITVNHTYNQNQIEWFKAGSALNYLKLNLK